MATQQFPSTTLRKKKIRADSFHEVAGDKGLATPNLMASKSALPVDFGQIQVDRPHPSIDSDISPKAQLKRTIIECSADVKRPTC
jgi:hypothetical protein